MNFGVHIRNDNIVETSETFTASLSIPSDQTIQQLGYDINPNPAGLQIGRRGSAVVSIIDNDCKMNFYRYKPTCMLVHVGSDDRYCLACPLVTSQLFSMRHFKV